MAMAEEDTIRMANQIAAFFAPYGEDAAVKGIAEHINAFWEPRMRSALIACAASPSAERLDPTVRRAISHVRPPEPAHGENG